MLVVSFFFWVLLVLLLSIFSIPIHGQIIHKQVVSISFPKACSHALILNENVLLLVSLIVYLMH